jgi:hypothetical protein
MTVLRVPFTALAAQMQQIRALDPDDLAREQAIRNELLARVPALSRVVARWRACALRDELPPVDALLTDETGSPCVALFYQLPMSPRHGGSIRYVEWTPDLRLTEDQGQVLAAWRVGVAPAASEPSPQLQDCLRAFLPHDLEVRLERAPDDPGLALVSLVWNVTDLAGEALAERWPTMERAARTAWACLTPWLFDVVSATDLGLDDSWLVEPEIEEAWLWATAVLHASSHLGAPGASGYGPDGSSTANLLCHTARHLEGPAVVGCFAEWVADLVRYQRIYETPGDGTWYADPYVQMTIDAVYRPGEDWTLDPGDLDAVALRRLGEVGWRAPDPDHHTYWLPGTGDPSGAGLTLARTVDEVLAISLRDFIFEILAIVPDLEGLRDYVANGGSSD